MSRFSLKYKYLRGKACGLDYELQIPHKNTNWYMKIRAYLKDENGIVFYAKYTRNLTDDEALEQLIADYQQHIKPPEGVYKDGIKLTVITLPDGCIISVCHDELLSGAIIYEHAERKRNQLMKKLNINNQN